VELSRLIRRAVVDRDGRRVGTVADIGVRLVDPTPVVTRVVVWASRRTTLDVGWSDVRNVDEDRVELGTAGAVLEARPRDDELLLRRDVLDTRVFDIAGKRLARVVDVRLALHDGILEVVGVEVGPGALLRRIGLARLAQRLPENPIAWSAVYLASVRSHALQLTTPAARRLSPADLAELLGHLPTGRGAHLLEGLPTRVAADALSRARPRPGGRLVRSIAPPRSSVRCRVTMRRRRCDTCRHASSTPCSPSSTRSEWASFAARSRTRRAPPAGP
jgi:sporulation protein YlmC with PRC-barrel domain